MERFEYILPLLPAWYVLVDTVNQLWVWREFIVLLFNKRKRAIHDVIAGAVVMKQEYTEPVAAPRSVADAPSPVS
ncbi:MAG: hypothetical protein NXH81_07740 [Halieaceae bacterium]|uniref:hypothetical protein n=1 Tax=Haliea alexandrii TaxID=2448162 RepID=UPI001304C209|nr:hypothetical protein [Haliea alexandrii]MCR9185270.1 hypothetical protein [Halieaceae bacterium]